MPRETRLTELLDQSKVAEDERPDGVSGDPEQAEQENAAQQYYGVTILPNLQIEQPEEFQSTSFVNVLCE